MKFDPEAYSITNRKEEIDDEILYVGRVAEFPNISVYEEDFATARNLIIDAIKILKKLLMNLIKISHLHTSLQQASLWKEHLHFDKAKIMNKWCGCFALGAILTILLAGCVAQPVVGVPVAPAIPPGVVYVAPTYVSPGPGYLWNYHIGYGWGWYHPHYGWHRGWR